MPRVNLETLLFSGDSKVACETLAEEDDPNLLSASFEAPLAHGVRYRAYDREASTRGLGNPKSGQANPKSRSTAAGNPPPKPPIIGLPAKIQTSGYAGRGSRRPTQGRIFPKKGARTGGGGGGRKSAVPEWEPGSPKVSCFGKVLSDRERGRGRGRRRREQQQQRGPVEEREREPRGCWAGLAGIFRCCGGGEGSDASEEEEVWRERSSSPPSRSMPAKTARMASAEEQRATAPPSGPGLGGMRRYTSGRREASWGEEAELAARGSGRGRQ